MPRPARRLVGPPLPEGPVVLGLETGGFHLGVSLWRLPEEKGAPQTQWHLLEVVSTRLGHQHARTLLAQVDAMLSRQGLTPSNVALIGVGRGPGGFTGVRVGMATALGVGMGLDATVWPVDSLAVLARHAAGHPGVVIPLIDARKSEVYGAAYRVPLSGSPERLAEPIVGPREEVCERLSAIANEPKPLIFGSGAVTYGGSSEVPPSWHIPCASHTGWLAAQAWEDHGREGSAAPSIDPAYVRPSDAELQARG
ncbi:MAG: tRNA (adenosine(37)-N6)-threonylcarbamoyltransferase complex dimerization subunit type 1 TsaB [Myxococcota bacterium]